MKKIVIAEKPSVAREIAKTLLCFDRGPGYIEGNKYIVTWPLGHLVELCDPAHYSERYKRLSQQWAKVICNSKYYCSFIFGECN